MFVLAFYIDVMSTATVEAIFREPGVVIRDNMIYRYIYIYTHTHTCIHAHTHFWRVKKYPCMPAPISKKRMMQTNIFQKIPTASMSIKKINFLSNQVLA